MVSVVESLSDLIKSAKDWKEASSKTNEKYKLETNLDFSKNKYYMLGSIRPENEFTGTLNGNDKTISNVTINGNVVEVLGLIGKINGGTIHGLTLKNITINDIELYIKYIKLMVKN